MNTNENIRTNAPENVIELGPVSTETKGGSIPGLEVIGHETAVGISE